MLDSHFDDDDNSDPELTLQDVDSRVDDLEGKLNELISKVNELRGNFISVGYAMGMALAMVLSWSKNASILWCMFHGLLSWLYVIYFAIKR